jgi:hypothetical protein
VRITVSKEVHMQFLKLSRLAAVCMILFFLSTGALCRVESSARIPELGCLTCENGRMDYEYGGGVRKISPKRLNAWLDFEPKKTFYGGVMVSGGDTLRGPVVVIAGPLDIQHGGVLKGDVWVINGRIVLTRIARITGKAKLVNSDIFYSRRAEVVGGVERYSCDCELNDEIYENEGRVEFREWENPRAVKTELSVKSGMPNRTDYELVRVGLKRENPRHRDPYVKAEAMLHIPLWKESGGHLGFDFDVSVPVGSEDTRLLVRGFKETFTNDEWQLSGRENSVAVVWTGDDFADYYERRGVSVGIKSNLEDYIVLKSFLSFQKDVSLTAMSIPSLLSSREKFRYNPSIQEGKRFYFTAALGLDTRRVKYSPTEGWSLALGIERGFADGPGDFSYITFGLDATRYNRLPLGFGLDLRAKIFSAVDSIPSQTNVSLNGYGGVRGLSDHPFGTQRGDRLALFSVEMAKELPPIPLMESIFTRWNLVLFWDGGLLKMADKRKAPFAFLDTPLDEWKQSVGMGIAGESFLPYLALYLAQDMDREDFDPRVILRASVSF